MFQTDFFLKVVMGLDLKLLKSLYKSAAIKGERSGLSILLFGRSYFYIDKTAKIDCLAGSKLYFNKPVNSPEPFPGKLEMYPYSKIVIVKNFTIHSGAHVIVTENSILKLGSGYINRNCRIKVYKEIEIGNDVAISENVTMWDSDVHNIKNTATRKTAPIKIGNHVWIGTNSIILKGVTIGDGSIIAASAVVNKDIPPKCLAAGVPAKVIRENVEWE